MQYEILGEHRRLVQMVASVRGPQQRPERIRPLTDNGQVPVAALESHY
jgi:hypothetical protein